MADGLVISLQAAKLFLRVDQDDEDTLITDAILAAQEWVEDYTVLVLTPREVAQAFDRLTCPLAVRAWPVSSIDLISYFEPSGAQRQIVAGGWWVNLAARPVRLMPAIGTRWPSTFHGSGSVIVTMTAGFEDPAAIPKPAMHALKLLIAHFYTNRVPVEVDTRAAAIEVPLTIKDLLRKWRRWTI